MTHDRPRHAARRSAAHRAAPARQALRVGSWRVSATAAAWSLSAILHGALLTTSYFVAFSPAPVSNPMISFARGEQATRIQVLLDPWPDPADERERKQEPDEETSGVESSASVITTDEVVVEPLPEHVAPDSRLDPTVATSEDPNLVVEMKRQATDAVEVRPPEDTRDVPSAGAAAEKTPPTQPAVEILDHLVDRLERFLERPETSKQVDRRQPRVAESGEGAVAPPTEESVPSNASSSQTTGVETGVETLDLPTPRYPSLSRRRGEEGLVLLKVEVLPDGTVGDIVVVGDAGFRRLTEAAIAAARKARFKPATRDGRPIRATVRIPFRFVLR